MIRETLLELKTLNEMTNADIARRADISERTVARILSGELDNPSLVILSGLSECFGVPIDFLVSSRHERIVRPDEMNIAQMYRSLSPKYKEYAVVMMRKLVEENRSENEQQLSLRRRQSFIDDTSKLSLIEIEKLSELMHRSFPDAFGDDNK